MITTCVVLSAFQTDRNAWTVYERPEGGGTEIQVKKSS